MFRDKILGMFMGVAYGDAVGATIEKLSFDDIRERFGRVETYKMAWHKADWQPKDRRFRMRGHGIFTDDTLMTMALMEVYNVEKRHLDAYDMAKEFVNQIYYETYYVPELQRETHIMERLFYPEQYIFTRHALANCEPREGGIGNMINCGAAMYIAPIGAVNAGNPQAAYNEGIAFAQGHQSSYGLEAAGVFAACVAEALRPGTTLKSVIEVAKQYAKDGTGMAIEALCDLAETLKDRRGDKAYVVKKMQKVIREYSPMGDDVNRSAAKLGIPSNHYAPSRLLSIEELPIALFYIVLNDGEFDESMFDGINSGRDTDSIGVMIGAILGAMNGSQVIPIEVIEDLEKVNRYKLRNICDRFSDTVQFIIANDVKASMEWVKGIKDFIGE